jgi:hypothetical protein
MSESLRRSTRRAKKRVVYNVDDIVEVSDKDNEFPQQQKIAGNKADAGIPQSA